MSPEAQAVALAIATRRHKTMSAEASKLVRVTSYQTGEPHWSVGRHNRFDCPSSGTQYGVHYSAPALSTAFAESVLHHERHFDRSKARWVVSDAGVLSARWVVDLQRPLKPNLVLFQLFGDFLTSMNIRNDISAGDDYSATQAVSQVIYDNAPDVDGVAYVSNRANRSIAVALFERSGVTAKQAPGAYTPLKSHADFGVVIDRFDIDVV